MAKKWWYDDYYDWLVSSSKSYGSYYWWGWWWSGWWWGFDWGSWWSMLKDKQKISDFKEMVSNRFYENYIPINLSVNGDADYAIKWNKLTINFSNKSIKYKEGKIDEIINAYYKVPIGWWHLWNMFYSSYISQNENQIYSKFKDAYKQVRAQFWDSFSNYIQYVKDYFEWRITQEEIEAKVPEWIKERVEKEISLEINEDGSMSSYDDVWHKRELRDLKLSNSFLKLIKSKIHITDIVDKEITINKWKKINKWYIDWRDWKPLVHTTVREKVKKKIFFLVDCSGSMDYSSNAWTPMYWAVSFLDAVLKSNIFDVTSIYYHSSNWCMDVLWKLKKEKPFSLTWWWEWFECVDLNIPKNKLAWVDYVICLTDLLIWEEAQQWLYDFLSKWKKHLVISFWQAGSLKWMNVKTISPQNPIEIVNKLLTILW